MSFDLYTRATLAAVMRWRRARLGRGRPARADIREYTYVCLCEEGAVVAAERRD